MILLRDRGVFRCTSRKHVYLMEFKKMRHIKAISTSIHVPEKAMSTETILYIVGSSMSAIGALLITISTAIGGDAKLDV